MAMLVITRLGKFWWLDCSPWHDDTLRFSQTWQWRCLIYAWFSQQTSLKPSVCRGISRPATFPVGVQEHSCSRLGDTMLRVKLRESFNIERPWWCFVASHILSHGALSYIIYIISYSTSQSNFLLGQVRTWISYCWLYHQLCHAASKHRIFPIDISHIIITYHSLMSN